MTKQTLLPLCVLRRKSVALSFAGMRPWKVWAVYRCRHGDSQPQKATRFARQKCLPRSCACATASYSGDFLANAECAQELSLCDLENVPPASVQTTGPPPTADEQSCSRQTARRLSRTLPESSGLRGRLTRE